MAIPFFGCGGMDADSAPLVEQIENGNISVIEIPVKYQDDHYYSMYLLPDNIVVPDDVKMTAFNNYVKYLQEQPGQENFKVVGRIEDDGTCHVDAIGTRKDGTEYEIKDITMAFENIDYVFAYMLNAEMVSIDGELIENTENVQKDTDENIIEDAKLEVEDISSDENLIVEGE